MVLWLDAQLPPAMAAWISEHFDVAAVAVRDLGLRDVEDEVIYRAAAEAQAVVVTKDADFVLLLNRLGPPPQVLWITCGNTSNAALRSLFTAVLQPALEWLATGESLVEIGRA